MDQGPDSKSESVVYFIVAGPDSRASPSSADSSGSRATPPSGRHPLLMLPPYCHLWANLSCQDWDGGGEASPHRVTERKLLSGGGSWEDRPLIY